MSLPLEVTYNQVDPAWCYFCDRPKSDCACHLDPNGPPNSEQEIVAAEEALLSAAKHRDYLRRELAVAQAHVEDLRGKVTRLRLEALAVRS